MPKIIKATNAEYFLKNIHNEISNCNYELTSDYLKMYSNDFLLFKINIE